MRVRVVANPSPRPEAGVARDADMELLVRDPLLTYSHAELAPLVLPSRLDLAADGFAELYLGVNESKLGESAAVRVACVGEQCPSEMQVVRGREVVGVSGHRG